MTNIEIRRKILEMLYERFKEHPYHRITPKEFKEALNIGLKELNYNIIYLEEKGYVELQKPLEGNIFVGARITTNGIDLVEDEYQFDIIFPIAKAEPAEPTDILRKFDILIENTKSSVEINDDLKEIIIEEIAEIKGELEKDEPSYSKVKLLLNKIKERDADTNTRVMAIIKNPIITQKLGRSSKKEL